MASEYCHARHLIPEGRKQPPLAAHNGVSLHVGPASVRVLGGQRRSGDRICVLCVGAIDRTAAGCCQIHAPRWSASARDAAGAHQPGGLVVFAYFWNRKWENKFFLAVVHYWNFRCGCRVQKNPLPKWVSETLVFETGAAVAAIAVICTLANAHSQFCACAQKVAEGRLGARPTGSRMGRGRQTLNRTHPRPGDPGRRNCVSPQ